MVVDSILSFLVASIFSWLVVYAIKPKLEILFLDLPNLRSSHSKPTPRGGGISFVIVGSLMHLLIYEGIGRWIPLICVPLALVGLRDDYSSLPAGLRYLIQVCTAGVLVVMAKPHFTGLEFIPLVIMVTAIINFTNFMDGIDGLLAGCGIILMASTSSWGISGAVFGFLLWNWNPARIFMGDVGSTFIGSVFVGLALQETTQLKLIHILLIGFPLFADSGICLLRRMAHRQEIFKPHRLHLYQRLNKSGWSHKKVALLYILSTILLYISYKAWGPLMLFNSILLVFFMGIYLDQKVAASFVDS